MKKNEIKKYKLLIAFVFIQQVVISGALCTVEDYVIMSQCAHNKAINLAAEGTVSVTDISQTRKSFFIYFFIFHFKKI